VAVLKAAGLIEAEMIEAVDGDPDTTCAVVVRITPEGYAALAGKIQSWPLRWQGKAFEEIQQAVYLGRLVEHSVGA
jgi:hypothetical protein